MLAGLLALAMLPLWAIGHWALTSYLSTFGVTPEQAGIDKQTLLVRVAVLSAVLTGLLAPALLSTGLSLGWFFLRTPLRFLQESLRARPAARPALRAWAFAVGLGGALAMSARSASFTDAALITLVVGVMMFGPMLYGLGKLPRPLLSQILSSVVVLTVMLALWAGDQAQLMAEDLRDHGRVSPMTAALGIRPVVADAAWTDLDGRSRHEPVVYLGEQGGVSTLYLCGEGVVHRVPTAQVRLALPGTHARSSAVIRLACQH
ncbi:hypothetical protein ACFC6U_37215 [Kitasatospora purpeofusca]|uniref:hypothetical protein n=1 Tax=Kitasatospora purpeofusca TaxID=67352 RepID=UPI0035E197D9